MFIQYVKYRKTIIFIFDADNHINCLSIHHIIKLMLGTVLLYTKYVRRRMVQMLDILENCKVQS